VRRGLLALKRRKYQENMLQKTEGHLINLETMVNSIEFASLQSQVVDAFKTGNDVLQGTACRRPRAVPDAATAALNNEASLEEVERLMEDSAEAIAYQDVRSPRKRVPAALRVSVVSSACVETQRDAGRGALRCRQRCRGR
jgi:hypothetical protein